MHYSKSTQIFLPHEVISTEKRQKLKENENKSPFREMRQLLHHGRGARHTQNWVRNRKVNREHYTESNSIKNSQHIWLWPKIKSIGIKQCWYLSYFFLARTKGVSFSNDKLKTNYNFYLNIFIMYVHTMHLRTENRSNDIIKPLQSRSASYNTANRSW